MEAWPVSEPPALASRGRLSDRRPASSPAPGAAPNAAAAAADVLEGAYAGSQSSGSELPVEQLSPHRCHILK